MDPDRRAVRILRGLQDRLSNVEQAVSSGDGTPNLLRSVTDRLALGDTVSATTIDPEYLTYNQDEYNQHRYK